MDPLLRTLHSSTDVNLAAEQTNRISRYNSGTTIDQFRALVVRDVGENGAFSSACTTGHFLLMEYYGYLRRDSDQAARDFWLNVLKQQRG